MTTSVLRCVLTLTRACVNSSDSRTETHRSTALTERDPEPPAATRKGQLPLPLPGIERRTITPRPCRVIAPFSATASGGQWRLIVLGRPPGMSRRPVTDEVRTVPAARASAGTARTATRTERRTSVVERIGHANTGLCASRGRCPRRSDDFGAFNAVLCCLAMALLTLLLAQAGSGGGGYSGGGGGSGEGDPFVAVVVLGLFGVLVLFLVLRSGLYHRKVRRRDLRVRTASAEAAEDDAYFAADELELHAAALFRAAQMAWDARDRAALAKLVGPDLLVEWNRRLDNFDRKHWHNRVEVVAEPEVRYVGITNREDDAEDRAVVRITAKLRAYVEDGNGRRIMRKGEKDDEITLEEYWTLARRDGQWMVQSIEQRAEGDHQLDEPIVASPWSDEQSLEDEAVTELAAADALPEGFTTADLAEVDFAGDARARALDLSVADGRFAPDVLEAAARRAVAAWAEAVDGDDAALEAVASTDAVGELLYGGDSTRRTRLVVRGPRVKRIPIEAVRVEQVPATMTVAVELGGSRYAEDRDTTTVASGSKDRATTFSERWTLALDGPPEAPWRIVTAM